MSRRSAAPQIAGRVQWAKTLVAALLLPACFGVARALVHLVEATGESDTVWVAMVAGVACWIVVYLMLPRPTWVYVFGHELTHVLWTWVCGGKVKRFKATAKGGHVVVTRNNFLVALAPYFFPIYAVAVVLVFLLGHWIWGWRHYLALFHLLLGVAYAFHVTLTWNILQTRQSDIVDQGYFFSAVIIWLGNLSVLVVAIPLLTGRVTLLTALGWCVSETGEVLKSLGRVL